MKVKKKKVNLAPYIPLYLMMLPGIVYFVINNYMPMFGLLIAFKKVNFSVGIFKSPWNGIKNFTFLFTTKDAYVMVRNTVLYNLGFIFIDNLVGFSMAVILESLRWKHFRNATQIIILIPHLLSIIIVSYVTYAFLNPANGFINNTILAAVGVKGFDWYTKAKYWPAILTIVHVWMGFGYTSILYYSTLIGIDKSLYEAAVVDGAGLWHQIKFITVPMMKRTVIMLMIMAIGHIFSSDFGLFYQIPMNSGLLYSTTQTIDTYVYRALLEQNNVGRSAAAGFLQSILGFILVMTTNAIVNKVDSESALF